MYLKYNLNKDWNLNLLSPNNTKIPGDFNMPDNGIKISIPGTVHSDLFKNKLICDPFYGENELVLQWIAECDWQYETYFDFPINFSKKKDINLVFEGLDTIAEILLNDKIIGKTDNMFVQYHFLLKKYLMPANNHLIVKFYSPLKYVQENKRSIKQFPSARHPDRVFIRKAQYAFGWDWGPAYPTMGIWRNVYLEQIDQIKIDAVRFNTLSIEKDIAETETLVKLSSKIPEKFIVEAELICKGESIKRQVSGIHSSELKISIDIPDVQLWWPAGYGKPHLYDLIVRVYDDQSNLLDIKSLRIGIRKVKLHLNRNDKNAFYFEINNKPIFLKGANWIPVDIFIPRQGKEVYENLVYSAKNANMNVLRVWGGGIYEDDFFYSLCDELGILVWQDFMFACAAYPEDEQFLANIKSEAEQTILRLQQHPCIILWCGNNENEWIWYRDTGNVATTMAGYGIFHQLLRKIVNEFDPYRGYWPSTPFGIEDDPNSENSGNRHSWDIWSRWLDYKEVKHDKSMFVTEFGFQAPADYYTLKKSIPSTDFQPQSKAFEFHNKQDEGPERLIKFLAQHLPVKMETEDFIYLTQLNQGFALQTCLEHWRLRWPETAGSIIWQINDVWPVTSWSLIDSDLRKKLAYYFTKRAFNPNLIAFEESDDRVDLIYLNSNFKRTYIRLEIKKFNIKDAQLTELYSDNIIEKLSVGDEKRIIQSIDKKTLENNILIASIFDDKNKMINRNYFLYGEWKHQMLPYSKDIFSLTFFPDNKILEINSSQVILFMTLQHSNLQFSDNGFILLPDETKRVIVQGNLEKDFSKDEIKIFTLNKYLNKMN